MRLIKVVLSVFFTLSLITPAFVQADPCIIPKPVSLEMKQGEFKLNSKTAIIYDAEIKDGKTLANYLAALLKPATGYSLKVIPRDPQIKNENVIFLMKKNNNKEPGEESYELEVLPDAVIISAPQPRGIFYGIQSLRQILPEEIFSKTVKNKEWVMPCVKIKDFPQFKWRGLHLDVSRHFMPKEFILKYIDLMALHKFNTFHWHLTDDQGWRIEIKKYPNLTIVGSWRSETLIGKMMGPPYKFDGIPYGGYYKQQEIKEIVDYARERYVNIVPEIAMPGHSEAAITAYPELGNSRQQILVRTLWGISTNILNVEETTIKFFQNVLAEIIQLFPSIYIHIGGDEVKKDQWKNSARVQARIKELGLKDEDELQSYFIKRMEQFLASKGRRLVGWDEVLRYGLTESAVIMSYGDVKDGHDVVMTPEKYTYFSHYQADPEKEPLAAGKSALTIENVYSYNPIPEELSKEEAKHILGAQGQVWTEYIATPERAEYMAFPCACALAEAVWLPPEKKNYNEFYKCLVNHLKRLDLMDVKYRKLEK